MNSKRTSQCRSALAAILLLCGSVTASGQEHTTDRSVPCFGFVGTLPNRIDAEVEISFSVPGDGRTVLEVYDIYGQRVVLLVDAMQTAGSHSVLWEGKDGNGTPTASGVYFIRLKSGAYSEILKIIVIRQER